MRPAKSCWRPTCTQATSFGQNASHGWLSTLSRSWEIPPTMRPNTCLTVVRDCDWIQIERSELCRPGGNRTRTCPALSAGDRPELIRDKLVDVARTRALCPASIDAKSPSHSSSDHVTSGFQNCSPAIRKHLKFGVKLRDPVIEQARRISD